MISAIAFKPFVEILYGVSDIRDYVDEDNVVFEIASFVGRIYLEKKDLEKISSLVLDNASTKKQLKNIFFTLRPWLENKSVELEIVKLALQLDARYEKQIITGSKLKYMQRRYNILHEKRRQLFARASVCRYCYLNWDIDDHTLCGLDYYSFDEY